VKHLRVLVLMHEELVPPADIRRLSPEEIHPFKMERDVLTGLAELGHEVQSVGVKDEVGPIRHAVEGFRPDVVFNLVMHFHGIGIYDAYVVSFLELMRCSYTGCNPRGLILANDKVLTKKILTWHRIPVPRFQLVPRGRASGRTRDLDFPLFVKSSVEHSSTGIAQASVVRDDASLAERVRFVHERVGTDALVEEYIEGRELYVALLGNERLRTFPPRELTFKHLPEGSQPIATQRVKWDPRYQDKLGVDTRRAKGLGDALEAQIDRTARRIYRALGLSGFARIDFRLAEGGRIFVLEANPNPDLCRDEDFAVSAASAGISYPALLQRLLNLGLRFGAAWKEA
jgi:D-alanine-D-alanine ligase